MIFKVKLELYTLTLNTAGVSENKQTGESEDNSEHVKPLHSLLPIHTGAQGVSDTCSTFTLLAKIHWFV